MYRTDFDMQGDFSKIKMITSVVDGYDAFLLGEVYKQSLNDILYVVSDGITLEIVADLLNTIYPDIEVLKLPAWDTVPYDRVSPNIEIVAERVQTLCALAKNQTPKKPRIIIASVGSVIQKLPLKKIFLNSIREIKIGSELKFEEFLHYATINGYIRVEQVMEAGEYAVRGDILDIFPVGTDEPLRIDLFGDEVERIRTFDVLSQRTTNELKNYTFQVMGELSLDKNSVKNFRSKYRELFGSATQTDELYDAISNGKKYIGQENWLPLFFDEPLLNIFDYIPQAKVIIGRQVNDAIKTKVESIHDYYLARMEALKVKSIGEVDVYRPIPPELLYLTEAQFNKIIDEHCPLYFTNLSLPENDDVVSAQVIPVINFASAKNINAGKVYEDLRVYLEENKKFKRIIACYSQGSRERLFSLMSEYEIKNLCVADTWKEAENKANLGKVVLTLLNLPHGFKGDGYLFISEQDILGEKQRRKTKKVSSKDFIADVSSLSVGELVVHIEHGIGRFLGLENITAGGAPHDCLKILYANDAKLFVPVENIDVLSRYGIEDENIQLDTLGSVAWQAKKAKVKSRIREIASKLIKIAAERQLKTSEIFIPESGCYDEFCAKFPYHETDDQLNAIADVLKDLGQGTPMDRLVCGDVGFGKTEVALRAAYAVASCGAQVALIVPTTLLARQHYYNFKKRIDGFPINIKMLSRLVTQKETTQVKQGLEDGSVDIVIGTHALLANNFKFSNLGLLIIDEEQHFGVVHKEKLKNLKSNVHVLTLTATPIPRTLQLSLTGVKQLSIIGTPPVDRLAARTFVMPFDKVMIKEAIYREKFRGGQTFFVCPRVSDIHEVELGLRELVPDIKIAVAHGQMPVKQLEDIMNEFADGKYDLLLSTTIIESGIDMPTVNTMIVYRADMFGLAQLYQLRGRIGRSKIRGYCYFTVPKQKKLNPVAGRRLNILQALDTLGAGFSLASHDMDIRGSGNLLGEEQSGHIKEVGIALYQHMLEEEIARQKANAGTVEENTEIYDWAPQITTGIPIMIPEDYVRDLGVRLGLYKRIGDLHDKDAILDMREELIDRFGDIPNEVDNLLKTVEIKQLCRIANLEKVDAGAKGILLMFHNNIFPKPDRLIDFIQKQFGKIKIRPDQKLLIEGNFVDYNQRVNVLSMYVKKLVGLLD